MTDRRGDRTNEGTRTFENKEAQDRSGTRGEGPALGRIPVARSASIAGKAKGTPVEKDESQATGWQNGI